MKPLFPTPQTADAPKAPADRLRADLQTLCGVLEDLSLVRLPSGQARAHLDCAVASVAATMRTLVLDAQAAPAPRVIPIGGGGHAS